MMVLTTTLRRLVLQQQQQQQRQSMAISATASGTVVAQGWWPMSSSLSSSLWKAMSSSASEPGGTKNPRKTLVSEGVHQTMKLSKTWRNKPLFRRQGDVRFKTGIEAAQLLVGEAKRRDAHETEFIDSVNSTLSCLAPIFDRNPRYAFVAKQLIEPERYIQFRVVWMDDVGVVRMNRGFRIQYNSGCGPYAGSLHLGAHVNSAVIKALGFDAVFSNALTGHDIGAAVGGSDFIPFDKSEAEMQRFLQSYMTELSKYVGPDMDYPWMGMGVGEKEMGYLLGQYKRICVKSSSGGTPFMSSTFYEAPGYGVVHFANEMLEDRNDTLKGKRCLILGSGKVAMAVAEKLLEYGAIPLTFRDASGHVYEADGINSGMLKTINKIKSERGALLGRYVIYSTSAQFNDPPDILDIPCDLCFPCGAMHEIDAAAVNKLADNGCIGVIEGGNACVASGARTVLRKRGLLYGPHTLTLTGQALVHCDATTDMNDAMLKEDVRRIYGEIKSVASEFNARGDLFAGANIAGFLRVANAMVTHGAV